AWGAKDLISAQSRYWILETRNPKLPLRRCYTSVIFSMIDLSTLSMTEIIRLQNQLQQELTRRFECCKGVAFSDIVGSTQYFSRFGDAAGRQLQQLHFDLLSQCLPQLEGRIVDTAGDGAFMVFPGADAAARSLIDFQKRLSAENAKRARD